ncbi:MAG: quinoprotein glucose dehydrogenase [Pseudohongiellaceae bacterium]|jgi:quinoprotein glucose dehydrogenase
MFATLSGLSFFLLSATTAFAWQEPSPASDERYAPEIASASDDWRAALAAIETAPGISLSLFAAEPLLANPVCLWVDNDGSIYVGETHRHHAGVTDIREHWDWLDDDLAARTVADRVAYIARFEGDNFADYAAEHDRLRLLRDTDGDGRADSSTVFADGFNDPAAGIGASILSHQGGVYYTCIPDLWFLRDDDGDDRADTREALSSGYGVKTGLLGHDLHGLRIGPDGRLYFSMGDRALHVETDDGVIDHPHTGAVLRCNLDGSGLEVFHSGLRNPQDLAFDAYGNLWTGDNNSDGGDAARWVHLVEGGDSGWRFSYQWIEAPVSRGPWNDEQLWLPRFDGQAAYLLPPVDNIANGPSGLDYYPGTGLSADYDGHFFLCDFVGEPDWSGVHSFAVEADGAGFTLVDRDRFLWQTMVTDCQFGPDGGLYFTDWVEGWNRTGKGRVFRAGDMSLADDPVVLQTAVLLRDGCFERSLDELSALLGHANQRVRQEAQFELVERGAQGLLALTEAATSAPALFPRLHGIWGLGMVARTRDDNAALAPVLELTGDDDAEVRAQAWRILGDERHAPAADKLLAGLADSSARVRLFAALAAGRIGPPPANEAPLRGALLQLLEDAGSHDTTLRHGAVMALLSTTSASDLWQLTDHKSAHVRMGAVLALRRLQSPLLGAVLQTLTLNPDHEHTALLALEVARAIHDVPVPAAAASLAELLAWPRPEPLQAPDLLTRFLTEDDLPTAPFVRRVLAANRSLGTKVNGRRVAWFAMRDDAPTDLRVEALQMLSEWAHPESRDPVMGDWRPIAPRQSDFLPELADELGQQFSEIADTLPAPVAVAFVEFVSSCNGVGQQGLLVEWTNDSTLPSAIRVAAMSALIHWPDGSPELISTLLDMALADGDGALRAAALPALEAMPAERAWRWLPTITVDGEIAERRVAYEILGASNDLPGADALLAAELGRLSKGLLSPELTLDLIQAAQQRGLADPRLRSDDALSPWLDSLFGGDSAAGQEVFLRSTLSCQRCHSTEDDDALRVGPGLSGVGQRLTRLQVLASIADPNRRQSPGYGGTHLFLQDGAIISGRIIREDAETVSLIDSDGELLEVSRQLITDRRAGISAMPEGLSAALTPREMRDLIEYLDGL